MAAAANGGFAFPEDNAPSRSSNNNGGSIRKSFRKSISRASRGRADDPPPPVPDLPPTLHLSLDLGDAPSATPTQSKATSAANATSSAAVSTKASASPAAALALSASASFAETDRRYAARQAVETISNVRLHTTHANTLLTLCTAEIKNRGLETAGIFRPLRLAESHQELDALIRLFLLSIDSERFTPIFEANTGGAPAAQAYAATSAAAVNAAIAPIGSGSTVGIPAGSCLNAPEDASAGTSAIVGMSESSSLLSQTTSGKASELLQLFDEKLDAQSARSRLEERIRYAPVLDVVALFKWGLRHLKVGPADFGVTGTGVDAYSWYDNFRHDEKKANYPLNAYSKYLGPRLPSATAALLSTVFELMSSVSAHHLTNFMPACTITRVLGYWVLGRIASDHAPPNFTSLNTNWTRAATITEHLFLAYLRDQISRSLYELPRRLTELVEGYPNLDVEDYAANGARDEFMSDADRVSRGTPQLPPALRSHRVAMIKATVRTENVVVSLKRPRTPSDSLTAALSAEGCDAEEDELVSWDIIQRAASSAVSSGGGREREMSSGSGMSAGVGSTTYRVSMSQSRVNVGGGSSPNGTATEAGSDGYGFGPPSPSGASFGGSTSDPAAIAAEKLQRKREKDAKRESAVLDEEHARVFGLVAGAIAVRRAVTEFLDPREAAAAAAAASASQSGQSQQRSMTSPPVYGSVYNKYGGRAGLPFSRSTSEFGNTNSPRASEGRASLSYGTYSSPQQSGGLPSARRLASATGVASSPSTEEDKRSLRKSISFSGKPTSHTRESSLTPLPEDEDSVGGAQGNGKAIANGAVAGANSTDSQTASDWASFAFTGFDAPSAAEKLTLTSPTPLLNGGKRGATTAEPETLLTPEQRTPGRQRRTSSSFNSMRRSSRRALLSQAAINGEFGTPNSGGGTGTEPGSVGSLAAANIPGPTHKLVSLETIELDETLSSTWQDQLLDFSLCAHFPPLVIAQLNEGLISTIHSALPDDALALSWILVDETVIPPRPPLPMSSDRSENASVSDKRSLFAPSIRSLTASIRKLRSVGAFLTKRSREKSSADAMFESGM